MQFKIMRARRPGSKTYTQGNRVQCLRYETGTDGVRRQRVIAKFDRWQNELPVDVATFLTAEEIDEWRIWKLVHDSEYAMQAAQFEIETLADRIDKIAGAISAGYVEPTQDQADGIFVAIDALVRTLRRADLERPKRARGRPAEPEPYFDEIEKLPLLPNFCPPGSDAARAYQKLINSHKKEK